MKRYLVTVKQYDGRWYTVYDRVKGVHYPVQDVHEAFADYPGTLQELANYIEIEELRPYLGVYVEAYKVKINSVTRTPKLYAVLNGAGISKKADDELLAGMPWGPKDLY